jgi:hypothetical protein
MLLFPVLCSAQFDTGSLKRKAEKALKGGGENKEEKSVQESVSGETVAPSGNAEEVIRNTIYAIRPLQDMRSVHQGMLSQKKEAQNFYDKCKEADYPKRRVQVQQAVATEPAEIERDRFAYDDIMVNFPEHFAQMTKEYFVPEINNAIETAYAEKTKGASRAGAAVEAAESAVLVADGILLVTPDNNQVKSLRADAQAAVASMGAAREVVYTGSFHKENAGKIVFSREPITAGQENPSAMSTAFTANDNIYGMMYFQGTFKEVTGGTSYGFTKLFVDDNEKAGYDFKLTPEMGENAWLGSEIIPDPARSSTRGAAIFTKAISELSPRRHTVRVQTLDGNWKVLAEGEFQLDCSGGLDRVAEVNKNLGEKKLSAVNLPTPAMRNPTIENECIAALKEWKEKPLKVIITDSEWSVQRHPVSGAIVSRIINTTTVVKKPDGGCRMFQISFEQPYNGKSYGKARQYGVGDSADIQCDKVK